MEDPVCLYFNLERVGDNYTPCLSVRRRDVNEKFQFLKSGKGEINQGFLVLIMLRSEEDWNQKSEFVYSIIKCKMTMAGMRGWILSTTP